MAMLADLLAQIYERVEEDISAPRFWVQDEATFAAIEALNEALLLVGRPTQVNQAPLTIQPNTVWQYMSKGMFAITNIQGLRSEVYRVTLRDFDYLQAYSDSGWENDISDIILQWCPVGMTMFAVHPAVSAPQTVLVTGISYPCMQSWPYNPATLTVPFADQFLQAFEKYAASYLAFKEGGNEQTEGVKLYQAFLAEMQRMTEIESRMDPYLFNFGFGVNTQSNFSTMR